MKKIIICLILAIILSNCEVGVKKVKAEGGPYQLISSQTIYVYKSFRGMDYLIMSGQTYNSGAPTIIVINLTKDELEVQLLREQLKNKQ